MQSIAPTRRLNRRSRDLLLAAAVVFLAGAALAVAGIGLHIFNLVVPFNPDYAVYDLTRKAFVAVGFGITFFSMWMALRAVSWKTDSAPARQVGEQLARQLDHQFVFIRNISKRGLGTIDAALVSKHGVLVLRITRHRGQFYNEGERWLRRGRRGKWRPLRWNLTRDIVDSVGKLKTYLKYYDLETVPVFAAVVFTRDAPDTLLKQSQAAVPAVHASQLTRELASGYFSESRLAAQVVQEVVNLLYQ